MAEDAGDGKRRPPSREWEDDLHHAEDFRVTGHSILSGAFARHAARGALRAAAGARGKRVPVGASLEALAGELELPPEIAKACRELAVPPSETGGRPDRSVDLGRKVVQWASRAAEG